ncbi:expressed unknown protein [Seminavis robusta]|uniref:Uncharacterized protein n=1 Tax=Seminavis robusta TaxID=568900 RepID=A0A9N8EV58_9STRA|nr:expressed unknown protein [Seminavis robusta]|eukprot:Sro2085_g313820.1 n/a (180) ;mRNA; f:8596-9217
MDFVATVLGLQLPTLSARDCLHKQSRNCSLRVGLVPAKEEKIVWGYDDDMLEVPDKAECDDETASTLSECESFTSSSGSLTSCVTFATPLVTATYLRPVTDKREKEVLYYQDADYRQFRMEYRQSLMRRRPSVTFSSNVVSQIHKLPAVENKDEVYYSSAELKRFLEEFIISLDQKQSC